MFKKYTKSKVKYEKKTIQMQKDNKKNFLFSDVLICELDSNLV